MKTREAAKQTREQLLRVIDTAQVTLWCVDQSHIITMMEGSLMGQVSAAGLTPETTVGVNVYTAFDNLKEETNGAFYKKPIEDILSGRSKDEITENQIASNGRWWRTRYMPLLRATRNGGIEGEAFVDGVIGVSQDVTGKRSARSFQVCLSNLTDTAC